MARRIWRLVKVLFICFGVLTAAKIFEPWFDLGYCFPDSFHRFLNSIGRPWPIQEIRIFLAQTFSPSGLIVNLYVAAYETLYFQGLLLVSLWISRSVQDNSKLSRFISISSFAVTLAFFTLIHGCSGFVLAGGIVFGVLTWHYYSLGPPFAIHFLWNLLHPFTFSL